MRALDRIRRTYTALAFVNVSLEVVDFVTDGAVLRALNGYINGRPKRPATIKVKSARGPLR